MQKHPFHLVDPSPWPLFSALAAFVLCIGAILFMHGQDVYTFYIGLALFLFTLIGWWRDVLKESNTPLVHTEAVQRGLKIGMVLFIASEVMFFFAFFWGYFNAALFPPESIGHTWPPEKITPLDPLEWPYLNTLILLLSGTTVTWAHYALIEGRQKESAKALFLTILLAICFTGVQVYEYMHANFAFKDGIYPSTFYMTTGFHGAHVIIGTIFLSICWWRVRNGNITKNHHVGFEAAAWYWHFVDIVWLFLFFSVYLWNVF